MDGDAESVFRGIFPTHSGLNEMFDCPRSILLCFPLRVVCTANQQPRYKDKEKTKRPKEERKRGEGLGQKKTRGK
jgi:hypothetical protein